MGAKADISYYCDICGKGCCSDNQVVCGKCASEEQSDHERQVESLKEEIDILKDEIYDLQQQLKEMQSGS